MSFQRNRASTDENGNRQQFFQSELIGDGRNFGSSGTTIHIMTSINLVEWKRATNGIRLKHWKDRLVTVTISLPLNAWLDEIARDQGKGPYQFRKTLMIRFHHGFGTLERSRETFPIWGVLIRIWQF